MLSAASAKGEGPARGGWTWRHGATAVLTLAGFGALSFYTLCGSDCSYLRGDILGVDLKILGYVFLSLVLLFTFLRDRGALRVLLASALGMEAFLVAFQVRERVFCPWCIAFALVVVALFAVNHERPSFWKNRFDRILRSPGEASFPELGIERFPLWVPAGLGFALVFLFFTGVSNPPEGVGRHVPAFGRGPVEVRLYSDYFCRPCQALEPRIGPLLERLVYRARIRFVQVPNHPLTDPYYRRYLGVVNGGAGFKGALEARRALYRCAAAGVGADVLDRVLEALGLAAAPFDGGPTLADRDWMIREDRIFSTPLLVIRRPGGVPEKFRGVEQVEKALKALLGE
ncbi:MAG TPA: hypothetical protein PLR43_03520 [Syntrophales bacterium]|nr:hypothetical protein [Syntrophales bacterium]